MKSLLFLSQSLPYPPESGGTQRAFHVLQELQKGFEVHLVSYSRRQHQATREERVLAEDALRSDLTEVVPSIPYPVEQSIFAKAWTHGRALITGRPYNYFQYHTTTFGQRLEEVQDRVDPDLVHMDSVDFFSWLPVLGDRPVTCTHHDIESRVLAKRAETITNPLTAAYVRKQSERLREVEREFCPRFDVNFTMSPVDSAQLREVAPDARILEAPNAVDLTRFPLPPRSEEIANTVVFVGPTYLFANRDAVDHLLADIWPRVLHRRPDAELILVGKNTPSQLEAYNRVPNVRPLGRVDAIQPHVGTAACSVIPIRVGSGTRIKILESWALGRAVVTTRQGGEGLEVEDGKNALVREDPTDFAEAIVELLEDPVLRNRLGSGGRETVERLYTWSKVGSMIRGVYDELTGGPSIG